MKRKTNTILFHNFYIVVAVFLFLILIINLFYVSLSKKVDGVNLKEFAKSRTTKKNYLIASRGSILDRKGDVIAQNVSSYDIVCYLDPSRSKDKSRPRYVVDKEITAEKLSKVLGMKKKEILKRFNKKGLYQTELGAKGRNLSEIKKDEILSLNLPGVEFIERQKRYYPYGDFLSYTVGYAKEHELEDDKNKKVLVGEMGIEKYYDKELSGVDGYTEFQKDLRGFKIPNTPEINVPAKRGMDINLTIDASIQLFVDQAMYNTKKKNSYPWEWMSIVIADAKTGEILGMGQYPSFDPNKRDIKNYLDLNVAYAYEPGSIMKTYTFLTAMKAGLYNPKEKYKAGRYVTKDKTVISDWDKASGWGVINMEQAYSLSANTGVIRLMNKGISGEELKDSLRNFGFGEKTDIKLANEAKGRLAFKYETEVLNAAFGQGLTTTAIQHIQALTSISNDGKLLKPYIIKSIYDPNQNKNVFEGKTEVLREVINKDEAKEIRRLMALTTMGPKKYSVGSQYNMGKKIGLIGKTGTAQLYNPKTKRYYKNTYIKSFAGMFPYKDPKIIVYAASKGPGLNSIYLANTVKEIVNNISGYMNYTEKDEKIVNKYEMKNFRNVSKEKAIEELKDNNLKYIILGDGDKIINQYPEKGIKITKNNNIILLSNYNELKVPNYIGLSFKEAKIVSDMLGIKIEVKGSGYVSSQSLKAGSKYKKEDKVTLVLKNKLKK